MDICEDIVVEQVSENFVNECLEYCWGIGQTVGHCQVLIVPPHGVEGCFQLIPLLDSYIVMIWAFLSCSSAAGKSSSR